MVLSERLPGLLKTPNAMDPRLVKLFTIALSTMEFITHFGYSEFLWQQQKSLFKFEIFSDVWENV